MAGYKVGDTEDCTVGDTEDCTVDDEVDCADSSEYVDTEDYGHHRGK